MGNIRNFRWGILYYALGMVFLSLMPTAIMQAQEGEDTYLGYYEDEYPNRLDNNLLFKNICLEAVLRLNPDLDINNIAYGDRLRLPVNEPCYQYDKSSDGWWNFSDGNPPRLKYYENGQWLDEPYYSDEVIYVLPESVEEIAAKYNICVDDLLAENILLQDFAAYRDYAYRSLDIFIPKDAPPCDPHWTEPTEPITATAVEIPVSQLNPLFFVEEYNICPESILQLRWDTKHFYQPSQLESDSTVTRDIPNDAKPCYNEQGQRLSYYDEMGRPLEEPIYSDLPVYIASPGETLTTIADQTGVCLIDLLRVNHFPDMPLIVAMELFIPPARPCPDDIEARLLDSEYTFLDYISLEINICQEDLLPLNPHFSKTKDTWFLANRLFQWNNSDVEKWIIIPKDAKPCYWQYHPDEGDSIFDIERELNVCYQEFRLKKYVGFYTTIPTSTFTLYVPYDVKPCYNEAGQRLNYSQPSEMQYVDMPIHIFQLGDTAYRISQQYNVCVPDLLDANPMLVSRLPTGFPVFIPQTRPCYDEASGMPLIYEDEAGNPLPQPQVSDKLIYYGGQPFGRISWYYNICMNRIVDANQAKLDLETSYLGWIIPHDRPPCYDAYGQQIYYVCYNKPVDFSVDYRHEEPPLSFDVDGSYCYDVSKPETVIWYQNKAHQIVSHYRTPLESRAFSAWCLGVPLEDINTINDAVDVSSMLPPNFRVLPLPTRKCYIQNPEVLEGHTVHQVKSGETLISIAKQYDKPHQWIAQANDLDDQNMIWVGQMLIIPSGLTLSHVYLLAGGLISMVVLIIGVRVVMLQKH